MEDKKEWNKVPLSVPKLKNITHMQIDWFEDINFIRSSKYVKCSTHDRQKFGHYAKRQRLTDQYEQS